MSAETKVAAAAPHVYQAIAEVQAELAKTGIAKTRKNQQGSGYMFRGIDDVYSALAPLLSAHKLCVIPRVLARECVDRQSKSGGSLFYVTVQAEFDFVSAIDGTTHTAATFGEAMDSGDKATNKAMSAAYKYAAFMTFAIPTEGDNDADSTTHEVAAQTPIQSPTSTPLRDDQFALIGTLAPVAGKSLMDICQAYKIGSIAELTEKQATALVARLQVDAKAKATPATDILDDEVPY